jgi:crotonobetainyl-CoA:carnitine CoA-transferase CaiB-like acyl-CoA transferase
VPDQILEGVKVLDLTRVVSGPTATQILGDLGANVVKVEAPGKGDEQREDRGTSRPGSTPVAFVSLNRNKRSIVLDLKSSDGWRTAYRLARWADVVVQNFRPGVIERLHLDYAAVSRVNPRVIYLSISGFGTTGSKVDRAANDAVVQAASGLMSITGYPDLPPVRAAGYPADKTVGIYAAMGVLGALYHRERSGRGQLVEISMIEATMSLLGRQYGEYLRDGHEPVPLGSETTTGTPNGAFPCTDGWIVISASSDRMWPKCCHALGLDELVADPRYTTRATRFENRAEIVKSIGNVTSRMTRADAEAALMAHGISCAAVRTIPEVATDPEFRDALLTVPVDGEADCTTVRNPLRFSQTPIVLNRGVPMVNEHYKEVIAELEAAERSRPADIRGHTSQVSDQR